MPWFTLHRNYSMSTKAGHVIGFMKGVKTWVPPAIVADAVAIGAQPVDRTDETEVIPTEIEASQLSAAEKRAKYFESFEKMLTRNQRGDFTASGLPHAKILEGMLGFQVMTPERDSMWSEYNASKQAN